MGLKPGLSSKKMARNHLSYVMVHETIYVTISKINL
jgi:hypothetical protein